MSKLYKAIEYCGAKPDKPLYIGQACIVPKGHKGTEHRGLSGSTWTASK